MDDLETVRLLSELAQETAKENQIDFGMLSISEKETFDLLASEVYEKFKGIEGIENERLVLLGTIVNLAVQNFVLNLQLLKK